MRIMINSCLDAQQIQEAVLADAKVKEALEGKTVKKIIVIPGRLVNIIV